MHNKDTSQNTLFSSLLALTMIDPATGRIEIVEATNKSANPSRICFITPVSGWHVTRDLNLLSFTMGANSNVSSNECVCKTIMASKPNQLQVTTTNPQANAIIERVHKVVNDMLRSFDLENNHENLEEDNPFNYFLQSTAWLPGY
jgi:hypothetical protein